MSLLHKWILVCTFMLMPQLGISWQNGQSGNATTNKPVECNQPPYSTHDWIADKAFSLLPDEQVAWLKPHRKMFLLGTEAPDNREIPAACNAPNTGYDDRRSGHSVKWNSDLSAFSIRNGVIHNRAASRAQAEYNKAIAAYQDSEFPSAAYYLGAMAHYIGDAAQYGHTYPDEANHSNYEGWVGRRTKQLESTVFDSYINYDGPILRRAYTAVKRISRTTFGGKGIILSATNMDAKFKTEKETPAFKHSVGSSLNLGINELADVLYYFWINEVK